MPNSAVKVLFIAGWARSGSTILSNILGQIDGFFSVGELCYIWDRGLIENWLCGCGTPFRECEVWRMVMDEAFGGMDRVGAHEVIRLRESVRTRHTPISLVPGGRSLLSDRLGKYPNDLEKLYRAIRSITASKVIVDSSKFPSHGYVLGMISAIDLYIVHLVRDPRAVAFSWLRKKLQPATEEHTYLSQISPAVSSLRWSIWNVIAEALWKRSPERYLLLRYEDFVEKPQEAVERILDLLQEKTASHPFVAECAVELEINHTISGNPVRFQTGTVELRLDEEWKTGMNRLDKAFVTALTWPLSLRYGYLGGSSR
jgi:hypothetical protein